MGSGTEPKRANGGKRGPCPPTRHCRNGARLGRARYETGRHGKYLPDGRKLLYWRIQGRMNPLEGDVSVKKGGRDYFTQSGKMID